jgi:ATP-dependent DNA ligase
MTSLGWFPPAPVAGPARVTDLPGAAWSMEAKVNGYRVLAKAHGVWTRQGTPLTKSKGLQRVVALLARWPWQQAPVVEGEYEPRAGQLWLFDLPDHAGSYQQRVQVLAQLLRRLAQPGLVAMPRTTVDFRCFYEQCRHAGWEGVVVKRRASRYAKCCRPDTLCRDWIKRRFSWD